MIREAFDRLAQFVGLRRRRREHVDPPTLADIIRGFRNQPDYAEKFRKPFWTNTRPDDPNDSRD
jgi:hypothetical protein